MISDVAMRCRKSPGMESRRAKRRNSSSRVPLCLRSSVFRNKRLRVLGNPCDAIGSLLYNAISMIPPLKNNFCRFRPPRTVKPGTPLVAPCLRSPVMRAFRPSRRVFLAAASAASLAAVSSARASRRSERFLAHEWGTFTTLQDEDGKELHGINIDDEPVPDFVHNLNPFLLSKPLLSSRHWQYRQKAAPRHHPYVTMRLETPVIYFYPPVGLLEAMNVDVHVRFRGGWLTEFYPKATPHAPLLKEGQFDFGNLTPETVSSLTWSDLSVGNKVTGPNTDEHVWLAPRKVDAAGILTREGESEKYLFYRGVGCQQAPLRIGLDRTGGRIKIHSRMSPALIGEQKAKFAVLWVTHVKPDGTSAFRTLDGFEATRDGSPVLRESSYRFEPGEYGRDNREKLHAAMHNALVEDGL